jgi:hypothetical protein
MNCRRAEELLSDHYEDTLAEPLHGELERHLEACPECRALRKALPEVVKALRRFPVLEPPAGLAERAARAALARPQAPTRAAARRSFHVPSWLQAAAAGLALIMTGAVLLATGTEGPSRAANRIVDRTIDAGFYLLERKDRLVEDVRILRVVIGTAFEGRLDKVNDRVDDYRRLLERRRTSEPEAKKSRGSAAIRPAVLQAGALPFRTLSAQES